MDYGLSKRRKFIKDKKGQGTLETTAAFVVIIILIGGIMQIWMWANNQIVKRQVRYNETRKTAGIAIDDYKLQWPVYQPDKLTENQVLLDTP